MPIIRSQNETANVKISSSQWLNKTECSLLKCSLQYNFEVLDYLVTVNADAAISSSFNPGSIFLPLCPLHLKQDWPMIEMQLSVSEKVMWGLDWVQQTTRGSPQLHLPSRQPDQRVKCQRKPGRGATSELSCLDLYQELFLYQAFFWLMSSHRRRAAEAHSATGKQRQLGTHLHRDMVYP